MTLVDLCSLEPMELLWCDLGKEQLSCNCHLLCRFAYLLYLYTHMAVLLYVLSVPQMREWI